jgi:hypothetical protein
VVLGLHERTGVYKVWHPMFVDDYFMKPCLMTSLFVEAPAPDKQLIAGLDSWQVSLPLTKKKWGFSNLEECRPEMALLHKSWTRQTA